MLSLSGVVAQTPMRFTEYARQTYNNCVISKSKSFLLIFLEKELDFACYVFNLSMTHKDCVISEKEG